MEIKFKKVRTAKDLTISSIVLISGIVLFFVNKGLGICAAVCGLIMVFAYKSGYKTDALDTVFKKKSEDLCKECEIPIMEFLNGKETTPLIRKGSEGGSIRLDVYYNQAEGIAFAQLHDFHNFNFEPATEIIELKAEKAEILISKLL